MIEVVELNPMDEYATNNPKTQPIIEYQIDKIHKKVVGS